jgi:DNA-binding NarL/FixJ family response regulator
MRILLADDHDLVLETLGAFLTAQGGIEVAACNSLDAACGRLAEESFDLVLLDYSMPGMDGLAGLARARAAADGPVAIMSGTATKAVAQAAIDQGAIGFLPKTMAAKSLVNAIRFMAAGEVYVPVEFLAAAEPEPQEPALARKLSVREREVLDGLGRGLSNKEIARELDLQEVTVKLHVKTLCRKLEAKNRTHAAMIGKEAGLV